jgi:hypothetical protein
MSFSVDVISLVKYLKAKHETIIVNQIGRKIFKECFRIYEQSANGEKD